MNRFGEAVAAQIMFVKEQLARKNGAVVAIPTYTAEEFAVLRPGESYAEFKRRERQFVETLCIAYIPAHFVAFVEIDSAGYNRFIAGRQQEPGEESRREYAALLYKQQSAR